MLIAALLMQLILGVTGPRVVHFANGQAVIEKHSGYEHVLVKDRSGRTLSESDCDSSSGSYDRIVAFANKVKSAAGRGDGEALAALMSYPLRVNTAHGKAYYVPSKAALLARFDNVFAADEIRKLSRIEPHEAFCRNGMSMLGDGLLWAQTGRGGALRAAVVNTGR